MRRCHGAFTGAKNRYFRVAPLSVGVKGQKIMLLSDEEGPNELIAGLLRREGIQMEDSTHGSNCGDVCIIREGWGLQT